MFILFYNDGLEFIMMNSIEEQHRCFYFIAAVLASARFSRIGFSPCLAVRARRVRVPGGSAFHLELGTIHPCWNLNGFGVLTLPDRKSVCSAGLD